jgi:hypothetical protein
LIPVIATILQFSPEDISVINKAQAAAAASNTWFKVSVWFLRFQGTSRFLFVDSVLEHACCGAVWSGQSASFNSRGAGLQLAYI